MLNVAVFLSKHCLNLGCIFQRVHELAEQLADYFISTMYKNTRRKTLVHLKTFSLHPAASHFCKSLVVFEGCVVIAIAGSWTFPTSPSRVFIFVVLNVNIQLFIQWLLALWAGKQKKPKAWAMLPYHSQVRWLQKTIYRFFWMTDEARR